MQEPFEPIRDLQWDKHSKEGEGNHAGCQHQQISSPLLTERSPVCSRTSLSFRQRPTTVKLWISSQQPPVPALVCHGKGYVHLCALEHRNRGGGMAGARAYRGLATYHSQFKAPKLTLYEVLITHTLGSTIIRKSRPGTERLGELPRVSTAPGMEPNANSFTWLQSPALPEAHGPLESVPDFKWPMTIATDSSLIQEAVTVLKQTVKAP